MLNFEDEKATMDSRYEETKFKVLKASDLDPKNTMFINRNGSWRTSLFFPQTLILKLDKMTNVASIYFNKFEYGCEMSFHISEYESGPFVKVLEKKYYQRSLLRKIKLGALPCKYIKIIIHSGVHVTPTNIHVFGFPSEDSGSLFGNDYFEILVANPQRIMY